MPRPAVDIVVPFAGPDEILRRVIEGLGRLELEPDDRIYVVDNRPGTATAPHAGAQLEIVLAPEVQSSYFARNRGVEAGSNPWVLFLDGDVAVPADILAQYFTVEPGERTAVLAGEIQDDPGRPGERQPAAARYAHLRGVLVQEKSLENERWAYAKTANCAIRRSALDEVGGFRENLRSGGDADMCFRLREAGWKLERRSDASVVHLSRSSVRDFLRQMAKHGSGSEWLNERYPGFSPASRTAGVAVWSARRALSGLAHAIRGDRDGMILGLLDAGRGWAFHLGRRFPNEVG
jgi:cellulose synthase/poly-beta-1,6-N-acetylglucosamine synthase-like glycosyltransferase